MPVTLFAATSLRAATRTGGFDDITPFFDSKPLDRAGNSVPACRAPGERSIEKKQIIFNYIKIIL